MIKRQRVQTYTEHLFCDTCYENGNEVEMQFDGMVLASNPPQYPHHCPECGSVKRIMGFCYPRTRTSPYTLEVGTDVLTDH